MSFASEQIRAEINKHRVISFARFMELALYCPLCGYYEKKKDTPGRRGDFYTSVSVGPLFGEMLAFQFTEWFSTLRPQPSTLHLVEAGAHDGQLAHDILIWLQARRTELFQRTEYGIIEPSPTRQAWQRDKLAPFASKVRWHDTHYSALWSSDFAILFSNELLDAFPVRRLGWDAQRRQWFEWGVTLEQARFVWTRLPGQFSISNFQFPIFTPPQLLDFLPDGFTSEVCPAAETWWREAAENLPHGKLLTFDYGLTAEELLTPTRPSGTLRAYRHHRLADNPLADPGEQDLTAHVNFTAIQSVGESAGLTTDAFTTQAQFLTNIAAKAWKPDSGFGDWTPEQTRQFQTLTHPSHLGRAFRVLIQSRAGKQPDS